MLHGEVEETVDVVLDSVRWQIRDEEGENILALGGDVVRRILVMNVHLVVVVSGLSVRVVLGVLGVLVVGMRERCESHRRAGRAGYR
jgi:hypothetical protein